MLMSDSLGGNAKTLMFVNVSPTDTNVDETQNSLQYATRVRCGGLSVCYVTCVMGGGDHACG